MPAAKRLLLIGHTPSANLIQLAHTFRKGVSAADCPTVELQVLSPLVVQPSHIQQSDAIVLLTPENLGYISGAMKDCFDRCYYPCLEKTQGKPVAAIIRAGHDGTGSVKALETICRGLKWRWVQAPLVLRGDWTPDDFLKQCHQLAETLAVSLEMSII